MLVTFLKPERIKKKTILRLQIRIFELINNLKKVNVF